MNESKNLSRRDWFRLRIPHQNQTLSEPADVVGDDDPNCDSAKIATDGLTPIAQPPNHDGLDLSELPPMREATLSDEQVAALFSDIKQLGTDVLLMQRSTGTQLANASKADTDAKLDLAQAALLTGSVQRVQIRYRWRDSLWIDTLKIQSDGYHIVRIAHGDK